MNVGKTLICSLQLLAAHKLRTFLSCSAIAIGIMSFVLMLGSGTAAERDIEERLRQVGTTQISITAADFEAIGDHDQEVETYTTLSLRDIDRLASIPQVISVSGVSQQSASISYQNHHVTVPVSGVSANYFRMKQIRFAAGTCFSREEQLRLGRVVVLGSGLAGKLFPGGEALGQFLTIDRTPFQIIGVASKRNRNRLESPEDHLAYVPLESAMRRLFKLSYLQAVIVQGRDEASLASISKEAEIILRSNHRLGPKRKNDFTIRKESDAVKGQRATTKAVRRTLVAVAFVSLLAGGAGILVVMLMSIKERYQEIGLRQALGARRFEIALQFLLESALISVAGGLLGALLGLVGSSVLCRALHWPVIYPWQGTILAVLYSVLAGVTFGILPAVLASRMDPASSLRASV